MTLLATFFVATEINLVILIVTLYLLTQEVPRSRQSWESIHDIDTQILAVPAVIRTERYVPGECCLSYWQQFQTDQRPVVR